MCPDGQVAAAGEPPTLVPAPVVEPGPASGLPQVQAPAAPSAPVSQAWSRPPAVVAAKNSTCPAPSTTTAGHPGQVGRAARQRAPSAPCGAVPAVGCRRPAGRDAEHVHTPAGNHRRRRTRAGSADAPPRRPVRIAVWPLLPGRDHGAARGCQVERDNVPGHEHRGGVRPGPGLLRRRRQRLSPFPVIREPGLLPGVLDLA